MLTGLFKTRKTFFGKVVIQVQIKLGFTERRVYKEAYRWRDATVEDLAWLVAHNHCFPEMLPNTDKTITATKPEIVASASATGFKPRVVK